MAIENGSRTKMLAALELVETGKMQPKYTQSTNCHFYGEF